MHEEYFFGQFGNTITASNKTTFLSKLATVDITVPSRVDGRRTEHREKYCIVKYMEFLADKNLFNYPLILEKGESPDFLLTFENTKTIGIEHRDVGSASFQAAMTALARAPEGTRLETDSFNALNLTPNRNNIEVALIHIGKQSRSKGVAGDRWEEEWSELVHQGIKEKSKLLNEPHFRAAEHYELILYDNTHVGYMNKSKAISLLQCCIDDDHELHGFAKFYKKISVIHHTEIYYDILT